MSKTSPFAGNAIAIVGLEESIVIETGGESDDLPVPSVALATNVCVPSARAGVANDHELVPFAKANGLLSI